MNDTLLKIGDLAKRLNISADTLRFYESNGLLTPVTRTESGYRLYSEHEQQRVQFILSAKAVGFTLNEVQELLAYEVNKDRFTCQEVKAKVDEKITQIDERIHTMKIMRDGLYKLSQACCGGDESAVHCTILHMLNTDQND